MFDNNGGGFLANIVAFYKGFFGNGEAVCWGGLDAANTGDWCLPPDIWSWLRGSGGGISFPSLAKWVPDAANIINRTLLETTRLGDIKVDENAALGYPNYAKDVNLASLPQGSNYTFTIGEHEVTNLDDYIVTPNSGSLPSGNSTINIKANVIQIQSAETEGRRQDKQYKQSGGNPAMFTENRQRKRKDIVDMNNQSKLRIYRNDAVRRTYRYLKILWFRFKSIRKWD